VVPRGVPVVAAGHDLVYIPAFRRLIRPGFIRRAYMQAEAEAAQQAFDPATFLATRWAAKEAAYKAICDLATQLNRPLNGLARFRDYEVTRRPGTPVPSLVLHGQPARLLEEIAMSVGSERVAISLSLTDEHDYAAGFVVLCCIADVNESPRPPASSTSLSLPR
jgi:holo-[acyl-carrier protein] synthase